MSRKLTIALSIFAVLGVLAALTLDGKMLLVTLLALVLFAFRTWLADYRSRIE